jgi:hypothetical protein
MMPADVREAYPVTHEAIAGMQAGLRLALPE